MFALKLSITMPTSVHCCCCRDWGRPAWLFKYVPVPMAMGIPAVVGAWLAVDMCVGGVILFIWEKFNFEAVSASLLMYWYSCSGKVCPASVPQKHEGNYWSWPAVQLD